MTKSNLRIKYEGTRGRDDSGAEVTAGPMCLGADVSRAGMTRGRSVYGSNCLGAEMVVGAEVSVIRLNGYFIQLLSAALIKSCMIEHAKRMHLHEQRFLRLS